MYSRALSDGYVKRNPVSDMYSKPTEARTEADFLEAHEAALLLESARTHKARVEDGAFAWMYPLLATFLLTGGRKSEVLGLEVDDVSLRLGKVYFRPNQWRRLKTRGSKRSVPLWPQLEAILRDYLVQRERQGGVGSLLFPGRRSDERMVVDVRKALDRIALRAGFAKGHIRLQMLRHTYTAARIQTLDRGQPVALYTVARELGHRSQTMIEDRYGHLHDRAADGGAEDVSFRVEAHRKAIGGRLKDLHSAVASGAAK
jgi:integrase